MSVYQGCHIGPVIQIKTKLLNKTNMWKMLLILICQTLIRNHLIVVVWRHYSSRSRCTSHDGCDDNNNIIENHNTFLILIFLTRSYFNLKILSIVHYICKKKHVLEKPLSIESNKSNKTRICGWWVSEFMTGQLVNQLSITVTGHTVLCIIMRHNVSLMNNSVTLRHILWP